jgi:sugar phosphate permease
MLKDGSSAAMRHTQQSSSSVNTIATEQSLRTEQQIVSKWLVPLRQQRIVIGLLFLAYASCLMCRANLDVGLPVLIDSGILNQSQVTLTLSCSVLAYTGAKFFSGLLADRFGGRATILTASLVIGSTNLGLALVGQSAFPLFLGLWCLNRVGQSAFWPAMTKLMQSWIDPNHYGIYWGLLSLSSRAGAIATGIIIGPLLSAYHNWQILFFLPAGVVSVSTVLLYMFLPDRPATVELRCVDRCTHSYSRILSPDAVEDNTKLEMKMVPTLKQEVLRIALQPRFWFILLGVMCLTPVNEFQSLTALFFKDQTAATSSSAASLAVVFPLGSALSVLLGGRIRDYLKIGTSENMSGIIFPLFSILCTAAATVLYILVTTAADISSVQACGVIFAMGFGEAAPYYILPSLYAVEVGGEHSAAKVGAFFDVLGHFAAVVFLELAVGENKNWGVIFACLMVLSFAASIFQFAALVWEKPAKNGAQQATK